MAHSPVAATVTTRHAVDASPFVSNQAVIAVEHHIPTTDYGRMRREFLRFIETAPLDWEAGTCVRKLHMFDEVISCVMWEGRFFITGTDIVRALVWRFRLEGQLIGDRKKFEEGVFSDLRNLKPGTDATLEEPRSRFLDYLYKLNCIRTHKKQKVFFWFSVPHEKLFQDAIRREKKREIYPIVDTLLSLGVDSARDARVADNLRSLFDARRGFPVDHVDTSSSTSSSSDMTHPVRSMLPPIIPSSPVSLVSTPRSAPSANQMFFPLNSPTAIQGFSMMSVGDQPNTITGQQQQQQQPQQPDTRSASPYSAIFGGNRSVGGMSAPTSAGVSISAANDVTATTPSFEFPFIIPPSAGEQQPQMTSAPNLTTETAEATAAATTAAQRLQYVSAGGGLLSPISPTSVKRDARGNFSLFHHNAPPGQSPVTPNQQQPNTLSILMNQDDDGNVSDDVEDDVTGIVPTLPLPPTERPRGRLRRRLRLSGETSPPPFTGDSVSLSSDVKAASLRGEEANATDLEDEGAEEADEEDEADEREDEVENYLGGEDDDTDDSSRMVPNQVTSQVVSTDDVSFGGSNANRISISSSPMNTTMNNPLMRVGSSGATTPLGVGGSLPSPSPYFMSLTGAPNIFSPIGATPGSAAGIPSSYHSAGSASPYSSYLPLAAPLAPTGRRRAPYHCPHPLCGREFKRFQHLKRHQLTHSGEKPFRCPDPRCARAFARSDNLAQHIRTHQTTSTGGGSMSDSSADEEGADTPPFGMEGGPLDAEDEGSDELKMDMEDDTQAQAAQQEEEQQQQQASNSSAPPSGEAPPSTE